MITYGWRILKRFVVLVPGVFIAYVSVRDIFPYFDRRLPLGLAIFFTYVLGAYVLVPAIIRAVRILYPPKHLPLYCVTPDGFASDPVNIGIIGTRQQLVKAMEKAGWYVADSHHIRHLFRHLLSIIFGTPYPTAPVSNLFLFGRKHDLAFEIPLEDTMGGRHHVRFWATTYQQKQQLTVRSIHWHHREAHVQGDNLLWVGAASLDNGIAPIRHNLQLTHTVHPDTDKERQFIVAGLKKAGLVKKVETIRLGNAYKLTNRVWRGYLHTDGNMAILRLKNKA